MSWQKEEIVCATAKAHGTVCKSQKHRSVSWKEALELPSPASHLKWRLLPIPEDVTYIFV